MISPTRHAPESMPANAIPNFDGDDASWALSARQSVLHPGQDQAGVTGAQPTSSDQGFVPRPLQSLKDVGLTKSQIQGLALKFLLNVARATGRNISNQIGLPFRLMEGLLREMKQEQIIVYSGGTELGDYDYELTPRGVELARKHSEQSSYFGAVPVPLEQYNEAVLAQSPRNEKLTWNEIESCLNDLILGRELLGQFGEAMHMGRGFFVHGAPGNGKTSICERVMRPFSETIWIPRALSISGEIIRLFDPIRHHLVPCNEHENLEVDRRWVRIRRPTIIVGGELRLSQFDVTRNALTGISEAPLLLKGNGGVVIIDDLGRQRFEICELMNRLIVPMEKGFDCLNLMSGRSFRAPFESMLVFSTNLDPDALTDEAFLRRIPYSIEVRDPTESEFRQVLSRQAVEQGVECPEPMIEYLLEKHYRAPNRPLRFCHPRDMLQQVRNACEFYDEALVLTQQRIDSAMVHVQKRDQI